MSSHSHYDALRTLILVLRKRDRAARPAISLGLEGHREKARILAEPRRLGGLARLGGPTVDGTFVRRFCGFGSLLHAVSWLAGLPCYR